MTTPDLRQSVVDALQVLTNQRPFSDIHVESHQPVGSLGDKDTDVLKQVIREMIDQDPSLLVLGSYCLGNIDKKPDNTYVIIGEASLVLNVFPNRLFVIGNSPSGTEIHLLQDLITQLAEVFVFAAGSGLLDSLRQMDYDHISNNFVYRLVDFDLEALEEYSTRFTFVNLLEDSEHYTEMERAGFAMAIWDYDLSTFRGLDFPHVVVINDKKQPMGGARANTVVDNFAVIGGVKTLPVFRRNGVGKAVSLVMTGLLLEMDKIVVLETDDENFPAKKIYEQIGYERIGESVFLDFGTDMIAEIQGDRDY